MELGGWGNPTNDGWAETRKREEVPGPVNRACRRNGTEPREQRGQRGHAGARQVGSRHDDEDRVLE